MALTPEQFEEALDPSIEPDSGINFEDAITATTINSESLSRLYAGQAAMVRGAQDDTAIIQLESMQPDAKASRRAVVAEYYQKKNIEMSNWLNEQVNNRPDNVQEIVDTAVLNRIVNDERQTSTMGDELAYVTQVAPAGDQTLRDSQAFLVSALNDVAEMVDSQEWLDDAFDFAAMMVPFGEAIDIQDITEAIERRPELAKVAGANLEEMVMNWHGLETARKEAVFPILKEAIIEATKTSLFGIESDGNLLKAASFLQDILDPEGAESLRQSQALDIALS